MRRSAERSAGPAVGACLALLLATPVAGQPAPDADEAPEQEEASGEGVDAGLADGAASALEPLHDRGIHPEIGGIVSGSGLSLGVGWRHHALGGLPLGVEVEGAWSIRAYHAYAARIGLLADARTTTRLGRADANVDDLVDDGVEAARGLAAYVEVAHLRYPRVDFAGLGPALGRPETDYAISSASADLVAQWQPSARLGLSARIGVLAPALGPGSNDDLPNLDTRYTPLTAPGLAGQPAWSAIGVAAVADTRDQPGVPARGALLAGIIRRFAPLDGAGRGDGAATFTRASLDGRVYVPLGSARHVVAARLLLSTDRHGPGGVTPFYLQPWLGGSHTLRGFGSYQFRGETLAHVSIEYRWRVVSWLDAASFVDAGAVAGVRGLAASPWRVAPGLGARVRSDDDVYVRLDWAHGDAGHRVLLSFGPAF